MYTFHTLRNTKYKIRELYIAARPQYNFLSDAKFQISTLFSSFQLKIAHLINRELQEIWVKGDNSRSVMSELKAPAWIRSSQTDNKQSAEKSWTPFTMSRWMTKYEGLIQGKMWWAKALHHIASSGPSFWQLVDVRTVALLPHSSSTGRWASASGRSRLPSWNSG